MMKNDSFKYDFRAAAWVDIGRRRSSNQDEIIECPKSGFFAVSDGMGGLQDGGETSAFIKKILPDMIRNAASDIKKEHSPKKIAAVLQEQVRTLSDSIYDTGNRDGHYRFGATVSGVWLMGRYAVFVNLGDSRGYILRRYRRNVWQVTTDHNVAALLVAKGELTREEAQSHPSRNRLNRFVGMQSPALPDVFVEEVKPGDRILLCSDGLHGMIDDRKFARILRSSGNMTSVCRKLIDTANENGGHDNISVVYIRIRRKT